MKRNSEISFKIVKSLPLLLFFITQARLKSSHENGIVDAEYPKGCSFLRCEKGNQCLIRTFWCKNPPCPSMLYCSKSRKESLRGPTTCDYVRCSKGYVCHVKVRHCRWEKCEEQVARCITEREYYEGPASCAGFKCPSGRRCILRESFCIRPPCKLLKSCVKYNDARLWLDKCRNLGCPSEYECFLRRPDEKCSHPPCKHTPDCTAAKVDELMLNEHCRGWICPKNQECSAQIHGPCDHRNNCKVKRFCHAAFAETVNSTSSQTQRQSFTTGNEVDNHTTILKTLPQIEQELILRDRQREMPPFSTTTKSTIETTKKIIAKPEDEKENEVDSQRPFDDRNTYHDIPDLKTSIFVTTTRKPPVSIDAVTISSMDKIITTARSSSWLEELKLKAGIDAIRFWMENAQDEQNYPLFQGWLQSVKEILGPAIYELWLEDVRGSTMQSPLIQKWLPPQHSMRKVQDTRRPIDPKKDTFGLSKPPLSIHENNRQNLPNHSKGGKNYIRDKWNPSVGFADRNSAFPSVYGKGLKAMDINAYGPTAYKEEPKRRLGSLEKSIANAEGHWPRQESYQPRIYENFNEEFQPYGRNYHNLEIPLQPVKNLPPNTNYVGNLEKQIFGYETGGSPAAIESVGPLSKNTKADIGVTGGESIKLFQPSFNEVVEDYEYDPWLQGFFRANTNFSRSRQLDERHSSTGLEDPKHRTLANGISPGFLGQGFNGGLMRGALNYDGDEWSQNYPALNYHPSRNHPPFPGLLEVAKSPIFRSAGMRDRTGRDWSKRLSGDGALSKEEDWTGMKNLFTPHRKLPISLYGVLRSGPIEDPRSTGYPLFYPHTPEVPVDEEFRLLAPYAAFYQQYMPRADDYFEYYERFHADTDNAGHVGRNDNLEDVLRRNYRPFVNDAPKRQPHLEFSMIDKIGKPPDQIPADLLESWQLHHRHFLGALRKILDKERFYHYGGKPEYRTTQETWPDSFENIQPVLRDNANRRAEFEVFRGESTIAPETTTERTDLTGETTAKHVNGSNNDKRVYTLGMTRYLRRTTTYGKLSRATKFSVISDKENPAVDQGNLGNSNDRTTEFFAERENSVDFAKDSAVRDYAENAEIRENQPYEGNRERFAKWNDFVGGENSQIRSRIHEDVSFNKTGNVVLFRPMDVDGKPRSSVNIPAWRKSFVQSGKSELKDLEKLEKVQKLPTGATTIRGFGQPRLNLRNVQTFPDLPSPKTRDRGLITTEVTSGPRSNPKDRVTFVISGQEEDGIYSDEKDYDDEEDVDDNEKENVTNRKFNETAPNGNRKKSSVDVSDYDDTYD